MMVTTGPRRRRRPAKPDQRGYAVHYRVNEPNHCPGCGRSHWLIGRMLAECAFCGVALPLSTMAMVYQDMRVAV
jgi:hypothetical protein